MKIMVWLISLFYLLLSFTAKAQEPVELLPLHDPTFNLKAPPPKGQPVAVQLQTETLRNISNNVLMAESWLRDYILPYYPSTNITTILVGHAVFCNENLQHKLGFVVPAIKNVHYSLTRWGLQNHIKVTTSLSGDCLNPDSGTYRVDLAENHIKPLLITLQEIGSPYVVNPPAPYSQWSPHKTFNFLRSHHESMKILGFSSTNKVSLVISSPRNEKPTTNRKLSSKYPLPPLIGTISPSPNPGTLPFLLPHGPHLSPIANPAFRPHLPPCEPSGGPVGAPVGGVHHALWCVAKPTVPPETLQEALDYACGEGGANCEAIREAGGSCYFPDTVLAHASYAFNSYWQKNKRTGGTCGFGGTAMLVNSDPSYNRCRFVVT